GTDRISEVGDITADGPMQSVRFRGAELVGDMTIAGAVSRVQMDLARSGTISVGSTVGRTTPVTFLAGGFTDENMTSATPFRVLEAFQWVSSDGITESISAPYVTRLLSTGTF